MTEGEWLKINRPNATTLMDFMVNRVKMRKRQLFACACCRRIWHLLLPNRLRSAVEAGEALADEMISRNRMKPVQQAVAVLASGESYARFPACAVQFSIGRNINGLTAAQYASEGLGFAVSGEGWSQEYVQVMHDEQKAQIKLLRDIIGNPFRSTAIDPAWLTSTVTSLAQATYEERTLPSGELDPGRLAVLADALEESGCDTADILNHLRGPGTHVRGCWVVDLLLGKE